MSDERKDYCSSDLFVLRKRNSVYCMVNRNKQFAVLVQVLAFEIDAVKGF